MGYPTNLLGEGEVIEFEMKPHWRALVLPALWLVIDVFVVALLVTWFSSMGGWDWIGTVGTWVAVGIGLLVVILWVIRPFLYWITTQYVFTNRRIITRAGLVSKRGRDMPLSKVNNVSFEVSVMGRMLNYGRLEIESAGEGDLVIEDVPNVEVIQREVYRLHEEDDERRRRRSLDQGGDPVPPSDGT